MSDNDVHREQLAARSYQVSNFKGKCCLEHYFGNFKLNINNSAVKIRDILRKCRIWMEMQDLSYTSTACHWTYLSSCFDLQVLMGNAYSASFSSYLRQQKLVGALRFFNSCLTVLLNDAQVVAKSNCT